MRVASACEVLLDVSGLGRLIGDPPAIARALRQSLIDAEIDARVAIGPTQTIARLLADAAETGHGPTLMHKGHKDHEVHAALCDLCDLRGLCAGACGRGPWQQFPVRALQPLEALPPAMNDRDRDRPYETFARWGVATLGDLAALPADGVSSRLGRRGVALQRLARGLDAQSFVPDGAAQRFTSRLELEWPIDALEPLSFVFARLLDPLSAALERADRGAIAIRLDLRLTDRSTYSRVLPLPAPMRDPRVLRTLLLLDLESPPAPASAAPQLRRGVGETSAVTVAVDEVAIELDPAPARATQFSLLQRALPSPETLSTLTARLAALSGESRVGSAVLRDTHEPGAFEMARYAPESDVRHPTSDVRGSWIQDSRTSDLGPRASVLRRQRIPPAIRVGVARGRPVHVDASKRGLPYGAIEQAAGPWRTSGGWWTEMGARSGGQGIGARGGWNRDEWDVALKSGAVCRIFQDRLTERWFLEGIYD